MKYMLLIYSTEAREQFDNLSEEEQKGILGEYFAISEEPDVIGGDQLQPTDTATTVRVNGSETLTTDGPFSETKEVLGGFYMLEADNIDRALDVASLVHSETVVRVAAAPVPAHIDQQQGEAAFVQLGDEVGPVALDPTGAAAVLAMNQHDRLVATLIWDEPGADLHIAVARREAHVAEGQVEGGW